MDEPSKKAIMALEALAASQRALTDFARELRQRPEVKAVTTHFQCIRYPMNPRPFIEHYVDAELHNGTAIAWLLDITWGEDEWNIDYGVAKNTGQQDTLIDFP